MLRKLATTFIVALTISLASVASASAVFRPEPPGSDGSNLGRVVSGVTVVGFTAQGSPNVYVGTRLFGDPAAYRAQPSAFGGGGTYADPPTARSNAEVPGLQP